MNVRTVMSAKGQVVIPKDVRDALGLKPGQQLDVTPTAGGVMLRPVVEKSGRSFDEITTSIRAIASAYKGPSLTIDDMNETIEQGWRAAALRSDCRPDERHAGD